MMRNIIFGSFALAAVSVVATGYLFVRLGDTEEALENHAIVLTQRLDGIELALKQLGTDASSLRADLAAQQIIVAEETANIRETLDSSVSELTSTIGTQGTTLQTLSSVADVSGLIDRWSPYVYDITCTFENGDGDDTTGSGSATLMWKNGNISFLTNAHVVEESGWVLEKCTLEQSVDDSVTITIDADDIFVDENSDVAYGAIAGVYPAMNASNVCLSNPRIGERVITLGYPAIGAKESVTVTEGIISGFDDDYYATSAKIEKGNSGGAAVSVERDCFLGLPTLVVAGRIESLARILPASNI